MVLLGDVVLAMGRKLTSLSQQISPGQSKITSKRIRLPIFRPHPTSPTHKDPRTPPPSEHLRSNPAPYLIHNFHLATTIALVVVAAELAVIAWIRKRYMDTPLLSAVFQVVVGGVLVFLAGWLIGAS